MVTYPFIVFFTLIVDGFNPYDELTYAQMKLEGGLQADLVYVFRVVLHIFLLVTTIYMVFMLILMYCLRHWQSYPGQYTWIAKKITYLPYGSLMFEEGEYFDCGICLSGIWSGTEVCRLNSGHVYKAECLVNQVRTHGNKYCVLSHQPISVQNPPDPEEEDFAPLCGR